jgi:hypothetical protein
MQRKDAETAGLDRSHCLVMFYEGLPTSLETDWQRISTARLLQFAMQALCRGEGVESSSSHMRPKCSGH